jgi:hypothetical protein
MKTSQLLDQKQKQPEANLQNDEVMAWEPAGENLWLPRRIRGSWRGGVLG